MSAARSLAASGTCSALSSTSSSDAALGHRLGDDLERRSGSLQADTHPAGDGGDHQAGLGHLGQRHVHDAARELGLQPVGDLEREPGLADPADARERDEAHVLPAQQRRDRVGVHVATHHRRGRQRQLARCRRSRPAGPATAAGARASNGSASSAARSSATSAASSAAEPKVRSRTRASAATSASIAVSCGSRSGAGSRT